MAKIEYHKARNDKDCLSWSATYGRMEVAHMWYIKADNEYLVRLYFSIPYGPIDYSKDKKFKIRDEAEKYINQSFRRFFIQIAYEHGYRKNMNYKT